MIPLAQTEASLVPICPLGRSLLAKSGVGHAALGMLGTPPLHGGIEATVGGLVAGSSTWKAMVHCLETPENSDLVYGTRP